MTESTRQGEHVKQDEDFSGRTKAFNLSFNLYSIKEWCALSEEVPKHSFSK